MKNIKTIIACIIIVYSMLQIVEDIRGFALFNSNSTAEAFIQGEYYNSLTPQEQQKWQPIRDMVR